MIFISNKQCIICKEFLPVDNFTIGDPRCRPCNAARKRLEREDNKIGYITAIEKWRSKNKEAHLAHEKLHRAMDNGKISKDTKCANCGKLNCNIEGHHKDYSKPLDVIWLCSICHRKQHKKEDAI